MVFGTQLDVHARQVQVEAPDMSHDREKHGSYTEFPAIIRAIAGAYHDHREDRKRVKILSRT